MQWEARVSIQKMLPVPYGHNFYFQFREFEMEGQGDYTRADQTFRRVD